jgi:aldehyde oxidoreductase
MVKEGIPVLHKGVWTNVGEHVPNSPNDGVGDPMIDHNHILQVSRVEVDPKTGKVDVIAVHSIADVGVIGNQLTLNGQATGGLEHAIGMALYEEYSDADKKYENMIGCGSLQCNQMPDEIPFEYHVTPRKGGPFGSGGASECFQSSSHACILNAVANAIGARIYEPPANPDMILKALAAKAEGKDLCPEQYFFGESFEDVVTWIKDNPVVVQKDGPGMGH